MRKKAVRIEILLPTHYKNHKKIEPEKRSKTIEEIYEKFGAYAVMPITHGGWKDPKSGKSHIEKMRGFYVDIDRKKFGRNVDFFVEYKNTLKKRFDQNEIYIVSWDLIVL